MPQTSLSRNFMPCRVNPGEHVTLRRKSGVNADAIKRLAAAPFDSAYDTLRLWVRQTVERGESALAVRTLQELVEGSADEGPGGRPEADLHAAMLSILTALHIEAGHTEEALLTGATALTALAAEPRRKDEPFLVLLAALLFDLAALHASLDELRLAEREIEKSARILERLARVTPDRYGPAHIMALDASTGIYRSMVKQAGLLAHHQVAATSYMSLLTQAEASANATELRSATEGLVESLSSQGITLMQMGKHKQAVTFLSKALRFLTRLEPELTARGLSLSVSLGEALAATASTRDKGVHLLNTMLHKALKLNAPEEHERISSILQNVKTRSLDIYAIWHKIFPR